jgi:anti-anti-sigma factor
VVVDCRDLTFIDSAGVRALIGLHSAGPVTLVNVRGQMLRVLEMLRLDHLANTYPTSGFRGAGMLAVGRPVGWT